MYNFRNYQKLNLNISDEINIIIGENAQGKTNILEAIYILAFGKSFRANKEKELVKWEEITGKVFGKFKTGLSEVSLEMLINDKGKKAKINGLEQRRLSDYIGYVNVVLFNPEDLYLVKGAPQLRRKFLDMEIGQINSKYLYDLAQYMKILQQKNNILKNNFSKEKLDLLEVWNQQLSEYAANIILKRKKFVNNLQVWAGDIHSIISNKKEKLFLKYLPSFPLESFTLQEIKEEILLKLNKIKEQELKRETSLIGPHRDDIHFYINEQNVQVYGSQGQQRSTALAIKLGEIELIYQEKKEYPILLLDDVLSELDLNRQYFLLKSIKDKVQTFITTTDLAGLKGKLNNYALFYIKNGTLSEK